MALVQQKAGLKCQCHLHCLPEGSLFAAGIPPIELTTDVYKRVYGATWQIYRRSGKALQLKCDKRQVSLHWEERLSGNSKVEWTSLLTSNLKAWLERDYGEMDFYLTRVMSNQGTFNGYLFPMKLLKLVESLKCAKMMPGTPCLSVWHFNSSVKWRWPPAGNGCGTSFIRQSVPNQT